MKPAFLTERSISASTSSNAFIFLRGQALGPSDKASFGFGWVSIKIPAIPLATAALAKTGTNSLCPPLLSP